MWVTRLSGSLAYHARQVEFLGLFNFKIYYIKGKENVKADAFNRRPDYKGNEKYKLIPIFK